MLEFLGPAMSMLGSSGGSGGISSILGGIGGLFDAFKGKSKRPVLDLSLTPAESQANSLYQALLDPNNSLIKDNTQKNLESGVLGFLENINALKRSDQRSLSRGQRGTFFNPERADETVDYLVSRGMPALRDKARQNAISDIKAAAAGFQGQAGAGIDRQNQSNAYRQNLYSIDQAKGGTGGQLGALGSGIESILKLLKPGAANEDIATDDAYGPFNLPWLNRKNYSTNYG